MLIEVLQTYYALLHDAELHILLTCRVLRDVFTPSALYEPIICSAAAVRLALRLVSSTHYIGSV